MSSPDVVDLDAFRMKRRLRVAADWASSVAVCMNCGAEFAWGRRHEHNCQNSPMDHRHPSLR